MKDRKILIGLSLVASGLFVSTLFYYLALMKAREELSAAMRQLNEARRERLIVTAQIKDQTQSDELPSMTGLDLKKMDKNPVMEAVLSRWVNIMNRPEAVDLIADQVRAGISNRYAGLFASLNLPPEKLSKVKQLLVERELAFTDAVSTSFKQGINPMNNMAAFQQMLTSSQVEIESQVKQEFDPQQYTKYLDYENNQGRRAVVNDVTTSLSYGKALSAEQQQQLEHTLAVTGNDSEGDLGNRPGGAKPGNNPQGVITETTIETAATFLAPEQVAVLKEQRQAQIAKWKLQQMFTAALK